MNAAECCLEGIENNDSGLKMACDSVSSTVTYEFAGNMCMKSTVINMGTVSEEAVVEVVIDDFCCAEGTDKSDTSLMAACPLLEAIVSYEWQETMNMCIRSRTVNTDGIGGTPMMDAVMPIKCCLAGSMANDPQL